MTTLVEPLPIGGEGRAELAVDELLPFAISVRRAGLMGVGVPESVSGAAPFARTGVEGFELSVNTSIPLENMDANLDDGPASALGAEDELEFMPGEVGGRRELELAEGEVGASSELKRLRGLGRLERPGMPERSPGIVREARARQ